MGMGVFEYRRSLAARTVGGTELEPEAEPGRGGGGGSGAVA